MFINNFLAHLGEGGGEFFSVLFRCGAYWTISYHNCVVFKNLFIKSILMSQFLMHLDIYQDVPYIYCPPEVSQIIVNSVYLKAS